MTNPLARTFSPKCSLSTRKAFTRTDKTANASFKARLRTRSTRRRKRRLLDIRARSRGVSTPPLVWRVPFFFRSILATCALRIVGCETLPHRTECLLARRTTFEMPCRPRTRRETRAAVRAKRPPSFWKKGREKKRGCTAKCDAARKKWDIAEKPHNAPLLGARKVNYRNFYPP